MYVLVRPASNTASTAYCTLTGAGQPAFFVPMGYTPAVSLWGDPSACLFSPQYTCTVVSTNSCKLSSPWDANKWFFCNVW